MRELNIEERLERLEENIIAIRSMLEKLLKVPTIQAPVKKEIEIMNVKQVAQLIGVDVGMIYTKCAKREIPFFKIGNQYRFKKQEILEWIKGQKEGPGFSIDDYVNRYLQKNLMRG